VPRAGLRIVQPAWFTRFVAVPVRDRWQWWFYRRRWKAAMTLAGLAPDYRGQPMLPVLGKVHRAGSVDLVRVGLVTGQAPADFAAKAENLAHAFGARLCRVRDVAPGALLLELVRADTLADPIPALPIAGEVDLAGLPVGRCEDGSPWRLRLASTHVLIAGATGSGKGSVIWSLIRALLPAIAAGWVQVWALDPKRMELSFGRALFHRYACHAAAMVELLEAAVAQMHARAGQFGGRTRTFPLSDQFPFVVVLVDELAFLTAYQPDRDLRKRAEAAIATLTSQGRSVGVCVLGALQDPRKDVISLRNLFSTRIALRLDESDQVDMVLGDGARDRGALADEISPLPEIGVLAGSRDASRCIGYLTKYLTKHLGDCHQAATDAQAAHAGRLADALRYEPCSPTCANWLRYGIQPKNARPGLRQGCCKGKAHRREYLGYAGRRVLVSRKWSGKTLADHRADRKAWLTGMLGLPATDPRRYTWELVAPGDPDHMLNGQRLLHIVADRIQWQTAIEQARRRAAEADLSATGRAA
jgi:DNA segregation ATPase FtsK/SpoIIIE, S-DNA-T family